MLSLIASFDSGSAPRKVAAAPYVHALAPTDAAGFEDLEFLRPLLRGKRIVQLGENGHGTGEATAVRARIVRFLHQELGYEVLAFESSLYGGHRGDTNAATAEPRSTLIWSTIGVWHTEEMLPLFEYLRRTRRTTKPLRLAGFDIQPIGPGKSNRPGFFANIVGFVSPPQSTNQVQDFDRAFIEEYEKGSAARRRYFRDNRDLLIGSYERLATLLANHRATLQKYCGREDPLVARQEALSMAAYVRQQTAAETKEYAELRDEGMAANVRFLVEGLFPGQKIIVWAHNYHVRYDNASIPPREEIFPGVTARSMGSWIRARYGSKVFTLLQYEHSGRAVDNARKEYEIAPPATGLLEERLGREAAPVFVLDVTSASRTVAGDWLSRPVGARYNGEWEEQLVPRDQADAVLFIRNVSPPKFLY